jgi:hypothetical protein
MSIVRRTSKAPYYLAKQPSASQDQRKEGVCEIESLLHCVYEKLAKELGDTCLAAQ